jgi:hypothetical protein
MTRDPYDRTPRGLLQAHLQRVGSGAATKVDAAARVQETMLRYFLDVLRAAMHDEGVDHEKARRVMSLVIYGCIPQPPAAEQRQHLLANATDLLSRGLTVPPPD